MADTPLPGVGWLAHLPNDPGAALRDFLTGWYADLPAAAPFPAPAVPIPPALQAFYDLAAGRVDILGQQDAIYPPDRLEIGGEDDERIIIAVENQGVWKILVGRDDPDPTLGEGLHEAILALVRAGVLDRREAPDEQFRWHSNR